MHISAVSRRFLGIPYFEVKDRIVSDTPNPPMAVTEGPKIFDVQCILGRIFMSLEKICVFK